MLEHVNYQSLRIEPVRGKREIRFKVLDSSGYLFTLEPGLDGFKLSTFDRKMEIDVDQRLL